MKTPITIPIPVFPKGEESEDGEHWDVVAWGPTNDDCPKGNSLNTPDGTFLAACSEVLHVAKTAGLAPSDLWFWTHERHGIDRPGVYLWHGTITDGEDIDANGDWTLLASVHAETETPP